MPLHAQRRLQLHAVSRIPLMGRSTGQQDIGEDAEEEEAPGEDRQHPGESDTLQKVQ